MLTFGLGTIILQGVSRRKSLAGVNIMGTFAPLFHFIFLCADSLFQEITGAMHIFLFLGDLILFFDVILPHFPQRRSSPDMSA
jgi:hypothetical protein